MSLDNSNIESGNDKVSDRTGSKEDEEKRICRVCGCPQATGVYFGVLACMPCKAFFIRCVSLIEGGQRVADMCAYNNTCPITPQTRGNCRTCRYNKCLQAGMSKKDRPSLFSEGVASVCLVCSDKANGIHFGIVSCEGCKKFFRRGLEDGRTYTCRHNSACAITPNKRNACRACRWNKCLAMGMSRHAIRLGRPSKIASKLSNKCEATNPMTEIPDDVKTEILEDESEINKSVGSIQYPLGSNNFPSIRCDNLIPPNYPGTSISASMKTEPQDECYPKKQAQKLQKKDTLSNPTSPVSKPIMTGIEYSHNHGNTTNPMLKTFLMNSQEATEGPYLSQDVDIISNLNPDDSQESRALGHYKNKAHVDVLDVDNSAGRECLKDSKKNITTLAARAPRSQVLFDDVLSAESVNTFPLFPKKETTNTSNQTHEKSQMNESITAVKDASPSPESKTQSIPASPKKLLASAHSVEYKVDKCHKFESPGKGMTITNEKSPSGYSVSSCSVVSPDSGYPQSSAEESPFSSQRLSPTSPYSSSNFDSQRKEILDVSFQEGNNSHGAVLDRSFSTESDSSPIITSPYSIAPLTTQLRNTQKSMTSCDAYAKRRRLHSIHNTNSKDSKKNEEKANDLSASSADSDQIWAVKHETGVSDFTSGELPYSPDAGNDQKDDKRKRDSYSVDDAQISGTERYQQHYPNQLQREPMKEYHGDHIQNAGEHILSDEKRALPSTSKWSVHDENTSKFVEARSHDQESPTLTQNKRSPSDLDKLTYDQTIANQLEIQVHDTPIDYRQPKVFSMYWLDPQLPNGNIFLTEEHQLLIQTISNAYSHYTEKLDDQIRFVDQAIFKPMVLTEENPHNSIRTYSVLPDIMKGYVVLAVMFLMKLPGFLSFHPKDQLLIARSAGVQVQTISISTNWYNKERDDIADYYVSPPTPDRFDHPIYQACLDFCRLATKYERDQVEEALLATCVIFATDYEQLENREIIESWRSRVLECFRAYTTLKYGSSSRLIERLFQLVVPLRQIAVIHEEIITRVNVPGNALGLIK